MAQQRIRVYQDFLTLVNYNAEALKKILNKNILGELLGEVIGEESTVNLLKDNFLDTEHLKNIIKILKQILTAKKTVAQYRKRNELVEHFYAEWRAFNTERINALRISIQLYQRQKSQIPQQIGHIPPQIIQQIRLRQQQMQRQRIQKKRQQSGIQQKESQGLQRVKIMESIWYRVKPLLINSDGVQVSNLREIANFKLQPFFQKVLAIIQELYDEDSLDQEEYNEIVLQLEGYLRLFPNALRLRKDLFISIGNELFYDILDRVGYGIPFRTNYADHYLEIVHVHEQEVEKMASQEQKITLIREKNSSVSKKKKRHTKKFGSLATRTQTSGPRTSTLDLQEKPSLGPVFTPIPREPRQPPDLSSVPFKRWKHKVDPLRPFFDIQIDKQIQQRKRTNIPVLQEQWDLQNKVIIPVALRAFDLYRTVVIVDMANKGWTSLTEGHKDQFRKSFLPKEPVLWVPVYQGDLDEGPADIYPTTEENLISIRVPCFVQIQGRNVDCFTVGERKNPMDDYVMIRLYRFLVMLYTDWKLTYSSQKAGEIIMQRTNKYLAGERTKDQQREISRLQWNKMDNPWPQRVVIYSDDLFRDFEEEK